jgi:SWIM zinc finger
MSELCSALFSHPGEGLSLFAVPKAELIRLASWDPEASPPTPPPPSPPAAPAALPVPPKSPLPGLAAVAAAAAPLPPNTCRMYTTICDSAGEECFYSIVPAVHLPKEQGPCFTLKNLTHAAEYTVRFSKAGKPSCSCPGARKKSRHGPCKHLKALAVIRKGLILGRPAAAEAEFLKPDVRAEYEAWAVQVESEFEQEPHLEPGECPF